MTQDKASQFEQVTGILSSRRMEYFSCVRCGALVVGESRERHLAWHMLLRNDLLEVANWLEPGEV